MYRYEFVRSALGFEVGLGAMLEYVVTADAKLDYAEQGMEGYTQDSGV